LRAFLKKPKIKQQKPKPNQKILCPYNVTVELSNEKKEKRQISCSEKFQAGHWWLMPVILATQEAEIRRTAVHSHPRQIVCKILS
jgi:hypothetical protein